MSRIARIAVLAGLAGASLLLSSGNASAADIRVCENARMRGPCVDLRHGVNDLRDWGISNRISSFSIDSGSWLMCTQPDFGGRCEVFDEGRDNLQGTPFQDAISSLRPVRGGGGGGGGWGGSGGGSDWQRIGIAVYTDKNFRGRSWVFSDDIRDLGRMGLNNQISSIRVYGGRWRICRERDFRGCMDIRGDVPNLRDIGFNDMISSLQEVTQGGGGWGGSGGGGGWGGSGGSNPDGGNWGGGGPGDTAVLYDQPGFRGRSVTVSGSASNLRNFGFNDKAMSIRVRGRWQICSDANFRGQCSTIYRDVDDLTRFGLDRNLSSLRRENR